MINIKTIIIFAILMLHLSCTSGNKENKEMDLYKNSQSQDIVYSSYDSTMKLWTEDFTEEWVTTSYGDCHIIITGSNNDDPVFLLPGLFGDATLWYPNAGELSKKHKVYALDMMNYGGKSRPSGKQINNAFDYQLWYKEILTYYGYSKANLVGLSYGSWTALSIASIEPSLVKSLVLLDPSESFMKMDGGIAWKGFWSFMFFPTREKYREFFDWIGGGYTDEKVEVWFEHMLDTIEFGNARMDKVPTGLFKRGDLIKVDMPVMVIAGGKPILYKDLRVFSKKVVELLPQSEVVIVEGTGHGLNMEKPELINETILDFISRNQNDSPVP